ncbi:MAG TPA: hypothetical protein VF438_04055 [Candidatus Paceibacterota bacterium]
MKKIYIIFVLIVVVVAFLGVYSKHMTPAGQQGQGKLVTGTDKETFSGTITAVDTSCFVDATCSVTVDGKKVILEQGRMLATTTPEVGRLIGVDSIGDLEKHIGDHANVYATTTPTGDYTIYGSAKYYVEVLKL